MRKLAALLLVVAASTAADAKPKPKDTAKVHIQRAETAHKAGKFDVALAELTTAYDLDPQPKLLFAIAQMHSKLDHCTEAIEYYEKFDAATKDESKQAVVKQAIEACRRRLADKPDNGVFRARKPVEDQPLADPKPIETTPAAAPVQVQPAESKPVEVPETKPETKPAEIRRFDEPPPVVKPAPVEPALVVPSPSVTAQSSGTPWYRDPLGDALVIGGVGAIVGSIFTYRGMQSELDSAEAATSLDSYNEHRDGAARNRLLTVVLAGGGLTLVATGMLRFALRDNGRESRGVAVVPTGQGALITWNGGF